MTPTIAALIAVALLVGVCCGMGLEQHRQSRTLRRMEDHVFGEIEREEREGQHHSSRPAHEPEDWRRNT